MIQKLEEELSYVQRHNEMEIGLIKDENDILKKELEHARRDWLSRSSPNRNERTPDRSMMIIQNDFKMESRQSNMGLCKT